MQGIAVDLGISPGTLADWVGAFGQWVDDSSDQHTPDAGGQAAKCFAGETNW